MPGYTRREPAPPQESDLHRLFDLGYVTVTEDLRLEVSARLREDWENGREYYAHHGQSLISRPADSANWPRREHLAWHNQNIYKP
jgi:putative restriction endonuclease